VLKPPRLWLYASVLADGVVSELVSGTPQGPVISPQLADIDLHAFDLHPDETRVVDLREGKVGFGFLGCHLRSRARITATTGRSQVGRERASVIRRLNLSLRRRGGCLQGANAAQKFRQIDRYVWWRILPVLIEKQGRDLRAGQVSRLAEGWFHDHGPHERMGTIRYPKAA
jgi:RNA-directed DNA polymerase